MVGRKWSGIVLPAAAYALITIALTWPLITRIRDGVPGDLGDPLLQSWTLWWNARTVPFSEAFWNAPMFYPAPGVLAFSDHLAGVSLVSTPLYWITGNIQFGYNVAFLLTFMLSAFFAYLLGLALTGREDAAFIGGLIYGFAPYRIDHLVHLNILSSFWMPLGLLGLHRFSQTRRAKWLAVFGLGWVMQGLSSGYLMMFFAVLVIGWVCWFVRWREWRLWLPIGLAWGLSSLLLAPSMMGYLRIHNHYGFHRDAEEIRGYSADITGVLQVAPGVVAWRWLNISARPEGAAFPGITAAVLTVLSLIVVRARKAAGGALVQRVHTGLAVVTLFFAAMALTAWLIPWRIGWLGISNTHLDKPLTLSALFFLAWIATTPGIVRAFQQRSLFGFYLAAAALMWMLSLGPQPTFLGHETPLSGPYAALVTLPGFDALRVPARFAMLTSLCLACAGALAFDRLARILSRHLRVAAFAGAALLAVTDGWTRLNVETRPSPWAIQASESADPVIELPIGDPWRDLQALYRSVFTGHPVVNGNSGHFPPWYNTVTIGLTRSDFTVLDVLSALGVRQVRIDTTADPQHSWQGRLESRDDVTFVGDDGVHRLYRLRPGHPTPEVRPLGAEVPIVAIETNVNQHLASAMRDGNVRTSWHTGPQTGSEEVLVDLGASQVVRAVVISMGGLTSDAPRDLLTELSEDRVTWSTVSRSPGGGAMLKAALRDPKRVPFTIDLGDRTARFIRLRQLGADPDWYWSIPELTVVAPGSNARSAPQSTSRTSDPARAAAGECTVPRGCRV